MRAYRWVVQLDRLVSGAAEAGKLDGSRIPIPWGWAELALAQLGDEQSVDWARRVSGRHHGTVDSAVVAAAARLPRRKFSTEWPTGPDALREAVIDDDTLLGQWRNICLGRSEANFQRVAHVDTTLLCNAIGLLRGNLPATPMTVLDLARLINTICVHDRICYLESENVERNDLHALFGEDMFVELPVASTAIEGSDYSILGDIREPLRTLYKHRTVPWINDVRAARAGTDRQRDAWLLSWETILGRKCDPVWLLRDPDEGGSSDYPDVWSTDTPTLLRDITDVDVYALTSADRAAMMESSSAAPSERSLVAFESTARAHFNIHIAEILGVHYAASLARVPALRVLAEDSRRILADLTAVPAAEQALQDVFGETVTTAARRKPDFLEIPFFASEVFQVAETPGQIPDVLAGARAKSAAFRRRLRELNECLLRGDSAAVVELRAALRAEATPSAWQGLWRPSIELASAAVSMTAALTDPAAAALTVIGAVLGSVLAGDSVRLILRRLRPVYSVVGDIRPIVRSTEAVAKLWDVRADAQWAARMRALTALGQIDIA
jgi:hypothetical protein